MVDTFGLRVPAFGEVWGELESARQGRNPFRGTVARIRCHRLEGDRETWDALPHDVQVARARAFPKILRRFAEVNEVSLEVNAMPLDHFLALMPEAEWRPFDLYDVKVLASGARSPNLLGMSVAHLVDLCDRRDGVGHLIGITDAELEGTPVRDEVLALKEAHRRLRERLTSLAG